jgi:hypothetical protein
MIKNQMKYTAKSVIGFIPLTVGDNYARPWFRDISLNNEGVKKR